MIYLSHTVPEENFVCIFQDQFVKAAPVRSGIGMALLQKMGWKQGEGLGKNKEGGLEPLSLDFKMDRRGWQPLLLLYTGKISPSFYFRPLV